MTDVNEVIANVALTGGGAYVHTSCPNNPLSGESFMVYVPPSTYRCQECGYEVEVPEVGDKVTWMKRSNKGGNIGDRITIAT